MKLQTNQVVGYLTLVKSYLKNDKLQKRRYWKCICVCKKEVERREDYLQRVVFMKNRTPSCGCKHSMKSDIGANSKTWKGYGKISGYYFGCITSKARKKNWPMNITKEYIWKLFLKQKKKCALTGLQIEIKESKRSKDVSEMTASLDRIDSNKGYIEGNVQWVHKDVNKMKNNYNQDYFLEMCRVITNYQKKETTAHQDNIVSKIRQQPRFAT